MSAPAVVLSQRLDGHIALVTLNRPEVRNAVNGEVACALEAVVLELEADDQVWAVVLTGAGPGVFCAGADLQEVSAGRGEQLFTARGGFAASSTPSGASRGSRPSTARRGRAAARSCWPATWWWPRTMPPSACRRWRAG